MTANSAKEQPDDMKQVSIRRASSGHDQRFIRRLLPVLRGPTSTFLNVLARELKAPGVGGMPSVSKIIGDDSRSLLFLRVTSWFLVAHSRLHLIQEWRAFRAENPDISLCRATTRFVAMMRRAGLRVSKTTLYRHDDRFKRYGIMGLVSQLHGAPPSPSREADRALIHRLCVLTSDRSIRAIYTLYRRLHKSEKLPGAPLRFSAVARVVRELMDNEEKVSKREYRRARA